LITGLLAEGVTIYNQELSQLCNTGKQLTRNLITNHSRNQKSTAPELLKSHELIRNLNQRIDCSASGEIHYELVDQYTAKVTEIENKETFPSSQHFKLYNVAHKALILNWENQNQSQNWRYLLSGFKRSKRCCQLPNSSKISTESACCKITSMNQINLDIRLILIFKKQL
jgi:hypothetical protein